MARILCCWELGAELGHLSNIQWVVGCLREQNHDIAVAARELKHSHKFSEILGTHWYQAPHLKFSGSANQFFLFSYPQLVYQSCFRNPEELWGLVKGWHGILSAFKPDVVVIDHSPTALFAAQLLDLPCVSIGNGFYTPIANQQPFGRFPYFQCTEQQLAGLQQDEKVMREMINEVRKEYGKPPYRHFGDLFAETELLLQTVPELDAFGARKSVPYLAVEPPQVCGQFEWHYPNRPKAFAYVSSFKNHDKLIADVLEAGYELLLYNKTLSAEKARKLNHPHLHIATERVNLEAIVDDLDLAITQGNHATVCYFLMQGVPQLMIPAYQEHFITASRCVDTGSGVIAMPDSADFSLPLQRVQASSVKAKAGMMKEKYQQFSMSESREMIKKTFSGF